MRFIHKNKLVNEFHIFAQEKPFIDTNQLMKEFYNMKTSKDN